MDVVGAASWLVQVVLEKLVSDGIDAAWAVARSADPDPDPGGDVHRLRSRLQSLHLVLSAAQERVPRARSEALLGSLRRLRRLHRLARDADNLLDEMLYHQIHRQLHPDEASGTSSSLSAVQSVVSKIRGAKRARLGGDEGATATVRIDGILKRMCEAGDDVREAIKMERLDAVVTCRGQGAGMDRRGWTTAYVTEPKIFGRDAVKEHIAPTRFGYLVPNVDVMLEGGTNFTVVGGNSMAQVNSGTACFAFIRSGGSTGPAMVIGGLQAGGAGQRQEDVQLHRKPPWQGALLQQLQFHQGRLTSDPSKSFVACMMCMPGLYVETIKEIKCTKSN